MHAEAPKGQGNYIDVAAVTAALAKQTIGQKIIPFRRMASTNEYAMCLSTGAVPDGTIIIAEEQTHGRGRHKRDWYSSAFLGLWFSIIRAPKSLEHITLIPLIAGLVIAKTLEEHFALSPKLKWPNDVLLSGKKVCGVLCESRVFSKKTAQLVIGIGMNVNHTKNDFGANIKDIATSLFVETGEAVDRTALLIYILQKMERELTRFEAGKIKQILDQWSRRCPHVGRAIYVTNNGQREFGVFKGIDNYGRLILEHSDGTNQHLAAGDTTINLKSQ